MTSGYKRPEEKEDLHPGQVVHQMCGEGANGPVQRRQRQAEDLHGLVETRLQGAEHRPAVRLRGHDGGRGGTGQSAWPSPELIASYTTPGKYLFWELVDYFLMQVSGMTGDWPVAAALHTYQSAGL